MQCCLFCNSNHPGREQSHLDTNIIRYATGGGGISKISFDKGDPLLCDDPVENFGVEDPVTTKPQMKGPPI